MSRRIARYFPNRLGAAARVGLIATNRFNRHDGGAMAGYIAYSVFLSIFPFLIFMSALTGILVGAEETQAIIDALFELAPAHIAQTVEPVLKEVTGRSRGGLLTFSAIGAVWIASNAVEAVRIAFDRAYEAHTVKGFIHRRLVAVGFVFFAVGVFAALGFIVILAPLAIRLAAEFLGFAAPGWLNLARYALGLTVFGLFLGAINLWLPNRPPGWRRIVPGTLVATVLWIIGASLFSVYLAYAPSYTITYGAFAGVIVTLLFFYLTGAAMIFGAEVNAALMAMGHKRE